MIRGASKGRFTVTVRFAVLNVENLFEPPRAMSEPMNASGNPILDAHARLNVLLQEEHYDASIRDAILKHLDTLGLLYSDRARYAVLRRIRGRLLARPQRPRPVEVVATGRSGWLGWVDLEKDRVDDLAMNHASRVIEDIGADVMAVVEAESPIALKRFTDAGIVTRQGSPVYPTGMLIDGNDDRGIDVGLLTQRDHRITNIVSHVDDKDSVGRRIFRTRLPRIHGGTRERGSRHLPHQPLQVHGIRIPSR